jgi:hypothetical protein
MHEEASHHGQRVYIRGDTHEDQAIFLDSGVAQERRCVLIVVCVGKKMLQTKMTSVVMYLIDPRKFIDLVLPRTRFPAR